MTNILSSIVLALLLLQGVGGKGGIGGNGGFGRGSGGGTLPPTMTNRWPIYTVPGAACGGTCTTGSSVNPIADQVGSNDLTDAYGCDKPYYVASAVNSQPAIDFFQSSCHTNNLSISTPIPTSVTTITLYAVVKIPPGSGWYIVGQSSGGQLSWRINGGKQELLVGGVGSIVTGSATIDSGAWETLACSYNSATGVGNLYTISGGIATLDATATNVVVISNALTNVGNGSSANGTQMAELGYLNGISGTTLSQIAAWSLYKYGI